MDIALRIDLSPTSHPSMIRGQGNGAVASRKAMGSLYLVAGALIDLEKSVGDHALLAAQAQPVSERAVSKAGSAIGVVQAQIRQLDKEIYSAITAGAGRGHGPEIRAYYKAKKSSELVNLGTTFKNAHENLEVVAEVSNAPSFLSGLDDHKLNVLKNLAAKNLVPEKVAEREESQTALDLLTRATQEFTEKVADKLNKWQNSDAEIIAKALTHGDET